MIKNPELKQQICIIGCGWLGLPLAKLFLKNGTQIKGSTTSERKLAALKSYGIIPFILELTSEGVSGNLEFGLSDCDTLILNIPPGFRKNPNDDYVSKLKSMIPFVEASTVKNIIFISSTSVYDDGFPFPLINENNPTSTASKSALQLVAAEQLFLENSNFNTTVIRFAGLFGKDRHPAKYLSGKSNLKNGKAPVNLIHLDDCISIIENIIEQNCWNTVFNASTTPHPNKSTYYTAVCKRLHIPLPHFDTTSESKGKIIDGSKLARVLGYEFKVVLE
ncbi:SDR family NAD(P)-dependent oxidoreductase [Psychroserpens sp. XS_ASV72]|uniref:SDR family NAD(P)-dependent oxidoreductase n=1 Tax=Psychroserpens sp. XS_ASV72 TaxID=3241293 RepID=UPI0035137615